MSGGRQWVRWLALLLAASMVVQVPALVGVGVSGASAATPSYTASLSSILAADGSCAATVEATWNNATLQSVDVQLNDRTSQSSIPEHSTVSGTSGSQTFSVPLNALLTGAVISHTFDAVVDFVSSGNSLAQRIYTNSQNGPCYIGKVGP